MEIDWAQSPDVEVVPGKVSGKPLLCETRILADMLVAYYESQVTHGMKPDEAFLDTNENYPGAGADRVRRVLDYVRTPTSPNTSVDCSARREPAARSYGAHFPVTVFRPCSIGDGLAARTAS